MKKVKFLSIAASICTLTSTVSVLSLSGCSKPKAKTISIDKESVSVEVGKTVTLRATTNPAGGTVSWSIDSTAIASFEATGDTAVVTGNTAGRTIIKATANGATATCTINVTAPEYPIIEIQGSKTATGDLFHEKAPFFVNVLYKNFVFKNITPEQIAKLKVEPLNVKGFDIGTLTPTIKNVQNNTFDLSIHFYAEETIVGYSPTFDLKFSLESGEEITTIKNFQARFVNTLIVVESTSDSRAQTIYMPSGTTECSCMIKSDFNFYHNGDLLEDDIMENITLDTTSNCPNDMTIAPSIVRGLNNTIYIKLTISGFSTGTSTVSFTFKSKKTSFESEKYTYTISTTDDVTKAYTYEKKDSSIKLTSCNSCETTITVPETIESLNVTEMAGSTFNYCANMTSFVLNKNMAKVNTDVGVFKCCYNLSTITVADGNATYTHLNTKKEPCNCIRTVKDSKNVIVAGCESTIVSDDVSEIGQHAFVQCLKLEEITVPTSVTVIGTEAFKDCVNLKKIVAKGVIRVYDGTFSGCSSLETVEYSDGLLDIYDYAFENCISFEKIHIPATVVYVSAKAFSYCKNISQITVDSGNKKYTSSIGAEGGNNGIFEKKSGKYSLVRGCKNTILNSDVTEIGDYAYSGCLGLEYITIPDSVTKLGSYVFSDCIDLRKIKISNNVTEMGSDTFKNCYKLKSAEILANITELPWFIFENCYLLETYQFSLSITKFTRGCFKNCYYLTEIVIPSRITEIAYDSFEGCAWLKKAMFMTTTGWKYDNKTVDEATLKNSAEAAKLLVETLPKSTFNTMTRS